MVGRARRDALLSSPVRLLYMRPNSFVVSKRRDIFRNDFFRRDGPRDSGATFCRVTAEHCPPRNTDGWRKNWNCGAQYSSPDSGASGLFGGGLSQVAEFGGSRRVIGMLRGYLACPPGPPRFLSPGFPRRASLAPRPLFSCSSSRGPWSLVSCQVNRNSVDSYSANAPLSKKMGKAYAKVRQHIGRRPLPLSPTPAMSAEMPELRSSPVWRRTSGINSPLGRSRADVHLMRTPMISDARRRSLRSE